MPACNLCQDKVVARRIRVPRRPHKQAASLSLHAACQQPTSSTVPVQSAKQTPAGKNANQQVPPTTPFWRSYVQAHKRQT